MHSYALQSHWILNASINSDDDIIEFGPCDGAMTGVTLLLRLGWLIGQAPIIANIGIIIGNTCYNINYEWNCSIV